MGQGIGNSEEHSTFCMENILCAQVHIPKAIVWYSIVEAEDHHLRIRRTEKSKTGGT
jgi:hypothetical protein